MNDRSWRSRTDSSPGLRAQHSDEGCDVPSVIHDLSVPDLDTPSSVFAWMLYTLCKSSMISNPIRHAASHAHRGRDFPCK